MNNVCLIAASLIAQGQAPGWKVDAPLPPMPEPDAGGSPATVDRVCKPTFQSLVTQEATLVMTAHQPEFSRSVQLVSFSKPTSTAPPVRPLSGSQLYQQRIEALKVGTLYTRIPTESFRDQWLRASHQPTYEEWVNLLRHEANAVSTGQGSSRLTVLLGDSLAMWFPPEHMSADRFWLNQGISGDTTRGVLKRLSLFNHVRPEAIHVMAGINDLRQGASDAEVLNNLRQIMWHLRRTHPEAHIYIYSILPTRLDSLSNTRIRRLNETIAAITRQEDVTFLDLQPTFADETGKLRRMLTTDGLHLSETGYEMWQMAMAPI